MSYYYKNDSHAIIYFMQLEGFIVPLLIVLVVIVTVESVMLFQLRSHYNRIIKGSKAGLISLLEGIQKTISANEARVTKLESGFTKEKEASLNHLQNLVVRRFNPFSNTGGDQSFILGLLDGNKNGVVISSLHSRENTRFYIKTVVEGVGDPHPLSDDEKMIFKKG